ncbi:sensor histidine kinase [Polycladidibacter hongkongensis]|uniref:sensor histidine kinase n=1 Tax=Polycladidibacter hongkongensis TaxID=1647556 RepID=UPI000A4E1512|nr:HAMP domain-containing sensor histidine kinase [Pseudovibrio hongkongensis]
MINTAPRLRHAIKLALHSLLLAAYSSAALILVQILYTGVGIGIGDVAPLAALLWVPLFLLVLDRACLGSRVVLGASAGFILASLVAGIKVLAVISAAPTTPPSLLNLQLELAALAVVLPCFALLMGLLGYLRAHWQMPKAVGQQQSTWFALIDSQLHTPIALLDTQGRLQFTNNAAQQLLACTTKSYVRNDLAAHLLREETPALNRALLLARNTGEVQILETRAEAKQHGPSEGARGKTIHLTLKISPLSSAQNPLADAGFWVEIADRSADKKREAELQVALSSLRAQSGQRMQLVARASHELRTPLNAILGFSELLHNANDYSFAKDAAREYLQLIRFSAEHLNKVVDETLDYTRLAAGKRRLNLSTTNAHKLCEEVEVLLRTQANQLKVVLTLSTEPQVEPFTADAMACRQIMINLLTNAMKHSPEGGRVRLEISQSHAHVNMTVIDHGSGIEKSELAEICEPFFQAGSSKLSRCEGAGLGLSVVKALVDMHAGQIKFTSTPGKGTKVVVSLPTKGPQQQVEDTHSAFTQDNWA